MCRAGAIWEISTSTTHFFYEPKTTLKIKFIYKKKNHTHTVLGCPRQILRSWMMGL